MPRSGSTLLQRMLMSHPQIHSVSEPWILLPLAYMSKGLDGVHAPYNHRVAQNAIADLIENLPRKIDDYDDEIARFARSIYEKICPQNDVYFLEKTPRYFLIIPYIAKLFPDAKFIFLFRNPLPVIASMINTWGEGGIGNLYMHHIDLYQGPACLAEGWKDLQDKSVSISYEMLIMQPEKVMQTLSEYLGLSFDSADLLSGGKKRLMGKMGDKLGTELYEDVSMSPLNKWKHTFNTKYRIWLACRYLRKIGPDVLSDIGYPLNDLLKSLNDIPDVHGLGIKDFLDYIRMKSYMFFTDDMTRKVVRKIVVPDLLNWKLRHKKQ